MATNQSIGVVQSVWSRGITDQTMAGRGDTDILLKGGQEIENLIMMEQGGLKKRPGLNFLKTAPNYPTNSLIYSYIMPWGEEIIIAFATEPNTDTIVIYPKSNTPQAVISNEYATSAVQDENIILFSNGIQWKTITFSASLPPTITVVNVSNQPYSVAPLLNGTVTLLKKPGAELGDYFYAGEQVYVVTELVLGTLDYNRYFIYAGGLYLKFVANADIAPNHRSGEYIILLGSSINTKATKTFVYQSPSEKYYGLDYKADTVLTGNKAWGDDNYPKHLAQFQNRLWCANANGDTKTMWASAIGDKYNFLTYSTEDDAPLSVLLAGDSTPLINNLTGSTTISAFTNQGVYSFINQTNSSITPTNFFIQKQNSHAASPINAVEYDQQLFYVQSNNTNIRSLTFNSTESLQNDNNVTILCPNLIKNPITMCELSSLDNTDDSYLFVLCSENNKPYIACFQSLKSQNIYGWTKWTFDDSIIINNITTVNNTLYAIVNNSSLCEFKISSFLDTFNNIDKYDIKCKLITNPITGRDAVIGDLLFKNKQFGIINIFVYDTDSVIIDGLTQSVNNFDEDYSLTKTKIIEIQPSGVWSKMIQLTIEHNSNNPFTLLSICAEIII
jgi:hypothetical protein